MTEATFEQVVNVAEILHEEISLIRSLIKTRADKLQEWIPKMCVKLEDHFEDKSKICAAIEKALPKEIDRDIRKYCPMVYKRKYTREELAETPISLVDETLMHMSDVFSDGKTAIDAIRAKYRTIYFEGTIEEKEEMEDFFIEQFGGLAELQKRLQEWKELSVDFAKVKQIHDERQKIDAFTKFMLRIQAFYLTKNYVAELAGISSKWMKNGIEANTELEQLAQELWKTDKKFKDIADWFNEQKIRHEKGMEILPIPV